MRRLAGMLLLIVPALAGAHGDHGTGTPAFAAQRPATLWEWLFGRIEAAAHVRIDRAGAHRYIKSDGLPDHATGRFPNRNNPNRIQERAHTYRVTLDPTPQGKARDIGHNVFGVAINGVPFDPATAEFWNRDRRWNYEAIGGPMNLGLDASNAHVQPDGRYHYHGLPTALFDADDAARVPTLIGWAADGFPIYAPWGYRDADDAGSRMMALRASYRLKTVAREGGPGGRPDGAFARDFEFVAGYGDLDRCNGRVAVTPEFPDGTYHYVITDSFPFIPRCWVGEPDASFMKRGGPAQRSSRGAEAFGGDRVGGHPETPLDTLLDTPAGAGAGAGFGPPPGHRARGGPPTRGHRGLPWRRRG